MTVSFANVSSTALARDYPPAPWTLWGTCLVGLFAVRAAAVEPLVPEPLRLLRLPVGLASGYIAVGRFGPGSTFEYSQLLAGVLVRHKNRIAPYLTHIAMDQDRPQRGARDLWHLMGQRWQFQWDFDDPVASSVQVWDGVRLVCRMQDVPINARLWPLKWNTPLINVLEEQELALIGGHFQVKMARVAWKFQPGPDGPLMPLKPVGPLLTLVIKGQAAIQPLQPIEA
ncbi:MAG: acetoacetate decarboxylase family protein [Chloroflexaceae bacterium]|nr:acetoacetate decarboxylase family protein [Chloroflexaceae bacterium]